VPVPLLMRVLIMSPSLRVRRALATLRAPTQRQNNNKTESQRTSDRTEPNTQMEPARPAYWVGVSLRRAAHLQR